MPKEMEAKLKKTAAKKFKGSGKAVQRRRDMYVYGAMRKTGWKPEREK